MSRVPDLRVDQLSPEERALHDKIVSVRSGVIRGPYAIWLRIPSVAEAANQLGSSLRLQGMLPKRVFELIVLTVARHWNADYVRVAHEKAARDAGLTDEAIVAVREGRKPQFSRIDEAVAYQATLELCEDHDISQVTYDRVVEVLGLNQTIELVTTAGYYTTAAMMVKAFKISEPQPG